MDNHSIKDSSKKGASDNEDLQGEQQKQVSLPRFIL